MTTETTMTYGTDWYLSAAEIGSDNPHAAMMAGAEWVALEWVEPLRWHHDRATVNEDAAVLALFDGDGDLTSDAMTAAASVLSTMLDGELSVDVDAGDPGADDDDRGPVVRVTVGVDRWMTPEDAGELVFDAVATLTNVTDPGTWGSVYLFDELARA